MEMSRDTVWCGEMAAAMEEQVVRHPRVVDKNWEGYQWGLGWQKRLLDF